MFVYFCTDFILTSIIRIGKKEWFLNYICQTFEISLSEFVENISRRTVCNIDFSFEDGKKTHFYDDFHFTFIHYRFLHEAGNFILFYGSVFVTFHSIVCSARHISLVSCAYGEGKEEQKSQP